VPGRVTLKAALFKGAHYLAEAEGGARVGRRINQNENDITAAERQLDRLHLDKARSHFAWQDSGERSWRDPTPQW